jgi:hypothetical protein
LASLKQVAESGTTWVTFEGGDGFLKKCELLLYRARMTKCECLVARSIRDSRKKKELVEKYTKRFNDATGQKYEDWMCEALKAKVVEVLAL